MYWKIGTDWLGCIERYGQTELDVLKDMDRLGCIERYGQTD